MHRFSLLLFCTALLGIMALSSCGEKFTRVRIETDYGNIEVKLLNSTPKHRDNFIKLAKEGFYDGLIFHRVIPGFMIQGGDPDSRNAPPDQVLGMGGPGYMVDAEIGAPHIRGALAAARNNNPQKQSSGSQFYIVEGQPIDDAYLDNVEQQKHIKYNPTQRQLYKELGGTPFLDQDYTVFGEVVTGMDVVAKIAQLPRDNNDRPTTDVKMKVTVLD
jgi:peptidyl-prolyl cis-trans isomerase B (cyclophilin B)